MSQSYAFIKYYLTNSNYTFYTTFFIIKYNSLKANNITRILHFLHFDVIFGYRREILGLC